MKYSPRNNELTVGHKSEHSFNIAQHLHVKKGIGAIRFQQKPHKKWTHLGSICFGVGSKQIKRIYRASGKTISYALKF